MCELLSLMDCTPCCTSSTLHIMNICITAVAAWFSMMELRLGLHVRQHVVQAEDTPTSIASSCGITPEHLKWINCLDQKEEEAHRKLHRERDRQALERQDANNRKVKSVKSFHVHRK